MNQLAFDCSDVDELDAPYALGALEPDEARAVAAHLVACREPHARLRELVATASALPASLEPIQPSAATRSRVMATVAATPREPRASALAGATATAARSVPVEAVPERRPGLFEWLHPRAMSAVAAVAVVAALAVGAWNLQLRSSLDASDRQLADVAAAVAEGGPAYRVSGSAGSGYLVERADGSASVILGSLAELAEGERYQMWLLNDDEVLTAGSFTASRDQLIVVPLERPVEDATTFAVSVETAPVETPTADPVMVAAIGG
ncbi:MAG: anti-sigma factor domain-containing protein [Candidatus Limnocylindria bacterium]